MIWAELSEDAELRKKSKEPNLLTIPPPPATDATVVLFTDDQISAIEVDPRANQSLSTPRSSNSSIMVDSVWCIDGRAQQRRAVVALGHRVSDYVGNVRDRGGACQSATASIASATVAAISPKPAITTTAMSVSAVRSASN